MKNAPAMLEKVATIYKLYAARKPVFISEGGVAYMYPEKKQDKTDWAVYKTNVFYASLPMLYPKVDSSNRIKYYMLSANQKHGSNRTKGWGCLQVAIATRSQPHLFVI